MKTISDYNPEQQVEALDNAIYDDGVSIVRGCVGSDMVKFLLSLIDFDSDYVVDASQSIGELEEISPIIERLYTEENIALGMMANFVAIRQDPFWYSGSEKAHLDDKSSDEGLSLLIPVEGDEALFAASRDLFEMNSDMFDEDWFMDLPEMIGVYGVGDLLIMRQKIARINGQEVNLNQLYHAGASNSARKIVSLDFVFRDLIYS
jgi:hypothetical protein